MQDGAAIPANEPGEWLKKRFVDGPGTRIDITWTVVPEESGDDTYNRLLDLLFGPRLGNAPDQAA